MSGGVAGKAANGSARRRRHAGRPLPSLHSSLCWRLGVKVDVGDEEGLTPLHYAVLTENQEVGRGSRSQGREAAALHR